VNKNRDALLLDWNEELSTRERHDGLDTLQDPRLVVEDVRRRFRVPVGQSACLPAYRAAQTSCVCGHHVRPSAPSVVTRSLMKATLSNEILSIVVVGQFNPAIVTPSWLERQELASPEEAASATLKLIHPDVSEFSIGEKNLQLLRDRLTLTTSDVRFEEPLRDLACGILQLLRHTPTTKVGLNYEAHFKLASTEAWHEKGHQLAPKEPWLQLAKKPGLASLTMRDGDRADGYRDMTVGPLTAQVLRVYINDHYVLDPADASGAQLCIEGNWQASLAEARRIARGLAG